MRKTFTAEIRVLLCDGCGAPLEAPVAGGSIACGYCHAQNRCAVRDERATLGIVAPRMPMDENERFQRLRSQDGRPMMPPPALTYLLSGSTFDPSKVEEAFLVYQATRKELRATHSPDAAERLYFLTLVASNYLSELGDHARQRALVETTLESASLPRHKQVMRCILANAAAKEGDLAAAERWLAPCDPRSADLESDSAWRTARAYIDTTRGDYRAVTGVLGTVDEQVPIDDSLDPWAAVLRANALERLGDVPAAVNALRARMSNEGAAGRMAIERIIRNHSHLHLCARSFGEAQSGHAHGAAHVAASGAGGGMGLLLFAIGSLLLLIAFGALGYSFLPLLGIEALGGGKDASLSSVFDSLGITLSIAAGPGIAGLIMTPLGFAFWRRGKMAAFLRVHGVPARGIVRGYEGTGTSINDVPLVEIHVHVMREGMAPYDASCKMLLQAGLGRLLAPGTQVPLRVHPERPDQILLELV